MSDTTTTMNTASKPAQATAIDAYVGGLDGHLGQLQKVQKELQTGTDGGGNLVAYLDSHKAVQVARVSVILSNSEIKRDYYYQAGKPVFVRETVLSFAHNTVPGTIGKTDSTTTGQFYLHEGALIYHSGTVAPAGATESASDRVIRLTREAHLYEQAARSPGTSVDLTSLTQG